MTCCANPFRVLVVVSCLAAALSPCAARAAGTVAEIEQLIAEDRLDEAIAAARAALETSPADPDLHMALAQALATKGRTVHHVVEAAVDPSAIAAGEQILPYPGLDDNTQVEAVYDPKLFDEALSHVRKAIRLAPERTDLRFSECYLLTDAGEIRKASAAIWRITESLPADPRLASTLASYGGERVKRGDHAGGAVLLGVVASAYPDHAEVQASYGAALARSGSRDEALAALDRAAELSPRDLGLQRKRALFGLLLQDFERARTAFTAAYTISRDDPDRFGAGAAAFGLDPAAAAFDFEELAAPAASTDPAVSELAVAFLASIRLPESRLDLAHRLVSDQQALLAIPVLHRILADQPDQAEARTLLEEIYAAVDFPLP
jgi:Flp pilus assembly protein TadD